MRISKVRITNHRASSAPATGLDFLTESQKREAAEHDRAVAGMEPELLIEIRADLGKRRAWDRKNPEHRWVMARLAAACRKLQREGVLA